MVRLGGGGGGAAENSSGGQSCLARTAGNNARTRLPNSSEVTALGQAAVAAYPVPARKEASSGRRRTGGVAATSCRE